MLSFEELSDIARIKRLSIINAEKDYLQELILFSLYSQTSSLVFKGGTCLYKVYKLDRFSEDLDFTLAERIDISKIANKIISDLSLFGINGKIIEIKEYKNEINVRMIFNGPLYKGSKSTQCFIPLNISLKEKLSLEPNREKISPIYKDIGSYYLFAMKEEEILAEKARAILTRDKPRDIYDLDFLIRRGAKADFDLINKKLKLYSLVFDFNSFRESLKNKKSLWQTDLKHLIIGDLPDFDEVYNRILNGFKK